ncbi:MAG: acyl--CoA ligase [Actinobacteria bacterium]|nr:acyl--CoA ligase [Actinomycetota bacterium]
MSDHTHRWEPPAGIDGLLAPGSPFELAEEDVLGATVTVFRNRFPHLRAQLAAAAARTPDAPYLVFPDRDLVLSFADVAASAARVARVLADHGVGPGDAVGFAAANVPAHAVAWWATVCSGAIVSSFNGWWTPAELDHGIALTEPKVIVADAPRMERLHAVGVPDGIVLLEDTALEPLLGPARAGDPELPDVAVDEDEPAIILFTSGTTGRPKGATVSHRQFVNAVQVVMLQGAMAMLLMPPPPDSADRPQPSTLCATPLFHVSGALPLASSAATGQKMVFSPPGKWDELTHLRLTQEHHVGAWSGVPTQFWRMLEHPRFEEFDVTSVANIGGGGAVFAPELFALAARRMPWARFGVGYGMSETLGSGSRLGGVTLDTHPASVGSVEPLCEIQIRDEGDQPLPDGEVGQICIRGACVFPGYWNDPAASAEALDADRWYRTGDFGRFDDGVLMLESRMRDLILRGGENVYPIEIENRLVEHPDIAQACVVGVPHHQLGQEVAAVVVLQPGAGLDADGVRAWVAETLAGYKVPTHVEFRADLPYNATGKVLKHEVEADLVAGLGDRAPGG